MAWVHSDRLAPKWSRRAARFARETLPLLVAMALATLLLCALEARFGRVPPDFETIGAM